MILIRKQVNIHILLPLLSSSIANDRTTQDPPRYALSDQRRQQLLQDARTSRTKWVEGEDTQPPSTSSYFQASTLSSDSHNSIKTIVNELQAFVDTLKGLKYEIIPDLTISDRPSSSFITLSAEVKAHQVEIAAYQQLHQSSSSPTSTPHQWLANRQQNETRFLVAYQDFITVLKLPSVAEIVYQIQLFVTRFEQWNLAQMTACHSQLDRPGYQLQQWLEKTSQQLLHVVSLKKVVIAFPQISHSFQDAVLIQDVMESFVMERVYQHALVCSPDAAEADTHLFNRLSTLQFISFEHLDLPVPTTDAIVSEWQQLSEDLKLLTAFVSPVRKMDCVLRICHALTQLLTRVNGKSPSADEFLPGLIYILLHANPPHLKSTVQFILEYRRASGLVSETGYFFTHLVSSVAFLEQVNVELLSITTTAFEEGLERCKQTVQVDRKKEEVVEEIDNERRVMMMPTVLDIRNRRRQQWQ